MKTVKLLSLFLLTSGLFAACTKNKDLYEPQASNNPVNELKAESEYLDFATTTTVKFNINYGELGQRILLNIYISEPEFVQVEGGAAVVAGTPGYKIFTNDQGVFEGIVELPTYVTKVYITTEAWGVKRYAVVPVKDGKAVADLRTNTVASSRAARRAATDYKIWELPSVGGIQNLRSIVGWEGNAYGKIIDDNGGLLTYGSYTADDMKVIKPHLGSGQRSTFSDSKNYASTDMVNTTIAHSFVNDKGETMTTDYANLFVTYIGEMGAWDQDGLGYYYYKTGEAPATRAEAMEQLKHYVILPNVSLPGDAPYLTDFVGRYKGPESWHHYYNYGEANAPAWPNERIQLLFEDPETGEVSTHFPPGYTIGFFLFDKTHSDNNRCDKETYEIATDRLWYSNVDWNSGNPKNHFSAIGFKDKILYGVEDGVNTSYNDLVFSVEADPSGSIANESRSQIEIVVPEEDATETTCKSYAFEDVWPQGGDYDLNDVIIKHHRSVTFDSYNYVKEVVDSFMAVQPIGAAEYDDGFAIQIPANQRGNITLPDGAVDETETNSIILFKSAKKNRNKWFVVKRTFSGKELTKVGLEAEDNNPFIIANYRSDENRTEIHLPKHKSTSKANTDQIGKEDDAYFVNKDGLHPFAIMLPVETFQPVTERVQIDVEYPDFKSWVESKMVNHTDWYLNYVKQ